MFFLLSCEKEITAEKESVRLRLLAVEGDYESQMHELQFEISNLRGEVQTQKRICIVASRTDQEALQTLTERNQTLETQLGDSQQREEDMSGRVKEMQHHLIVSRASIQSHVEQIESLRAEVSKSARFLISVQLNNGPLYLIPLPKFCMWQCLKK